MEEAIKVLQKSESVLMKRIRAMKDGSPKWAASSRLGEIRSALKLIKHYESVGETQNLNNEEYLKEALRVNPPIAQA